MSEPWVPEIVIAEAHRRRQKRRRLRRSLAATFVTTVLLLVSMFLYRRHQSEQALEDAIAETDRLDPGWRIEDLIKRQSAMPADQNAALPISAAHAILLNWKLDPKDAIHQKPLPQFQLDQKLLDALRKSREPFLAARAEALKAIPLKTGWYPRNLHLYFDGPGEGIGPDQVRHVGQFLEGVAMLQSQDGNHDVAWQTTLAILAAGRSFGEQPGFRGITMRAVLQTTAACSFERCLAQGTTTDSLLAEAMKSLADEANVPLFYNAIRCDRAIDHEAWTRLDEGKLQVHQLGWSTDGVSSIDGAKVEIELGWWLAGGTFKRLHAWILRFDNEVLAVAKLPHAARDAKMKELEQKFTDEGPSWANRSPLYVSVSDRFAITLAKLECAVAGLGVERFRLKHGRWPTSLDEVVAAKLLDAVPADVYDAKPLGYRKTTDGAVVFSVGQDGIWGGGKALDGGRTPVGNGIRWFEVPAVG